MLEVEPTEKSPLLINIYWQGTFFSDTVIQIYNYTKIQRYKDTKIQRYKGTKIRSKNQISKIKDQYFEIKVKKEIDEIINLKYKFHI